MYIYIYVCMYVCMYVYIYMYSIYKYIMSENGIYPPNGYFSQGYRSSTSGNVLFPPFSDLFLSTHFEPPPRSKRALYPAPVDELGIMLWDGFGLMKTAGFNSFQAGKKHVKNNWSFLNPTQVGWKTKPLTSFCFYPSCSLLSKPSKLPMLVDII